MSNFNKTRNAAFKLASERYKPGEPVFGHYSPIYIVATSNVKDTINLYQNYDSVLSVGSTGAHGYEALLNGATKVDMFDVNELQRLFFEYMNVAITYLSYEQFIKHFTLKKQNTIMERSDIKDLLSEEIYSQLVYFLPGEVEMVFTPLYDFFDSVDLIYSGLFRFEHLITVDYLKRNVSFYNEEEYYKLQKILRDGKCQFNYKTVSLLDVPKLMSGKYDLIILDNILQYYKNITGLETPYLVNMFIQKQLSRLLTDNGVIQANYAFEVGTDAFREKLKIPYDKKHMGVLGDFVIRKEVKEGINIPLVQKWDNYSYSFIPGVETMDGISSDNMVLTYRKTNK